MLNIFSTLNHLGHCFSTGLPKKRVAACVVCCIIITTVTNVSAESEPVLHLNCHDIPETGNQLCSAETDSPLGPVKDVIFFKHSDEGDLTFLFARKADIALIFIAGFSEGGKYTIVGEAEEGHPGFYIYETRDFLDPATDPVHPGRSNEAHHQAHFV